MGTEQSGYRGKEKLEMKVKIREWLWGLYHPQRKEAGDSRDYYIDNVKAFLMVLVIYGHILPNLRAVEELRNLYYLVFSFHMPLFVFTSGYLAKGLMRDGKFRKERYFSTLWLYLLFQLAISGVNRLFGQDSGLDLLVVGRASWYLLALSIWYLLVPLLLSLKPVTGLLLTALAGLLAGYADKINSYLALSRVLAFLPFFAAGLYLTKEKLDAFLEKRLRAAAFLVLLIAGGALVFSYNPVRNISAIVFANQPYSQSLGELARYGFLIRGGLYLFAVLISAACMLLIPRRKMWFSYVGKYSLAVYILHVHLKDALKYGGVFAKIKKLPAKYMLLSIPACILIALILGNPLFGKALNWIANPFRGRQNKGRQSGHTSAKSAAKQEDGLS